MNDTQPKPKTWQVTLLAGFFTLSLLTNCGGGSSSSISDDDTNTNITPEEGEELLGGDTTVFANTSGAFSEPASNLAFGETGIFKTGNSLFEKDWVIAPSSTLARDGLGPLFNARSCSRCHSRDGRGRPPEIDEEALSLLIRLSIPGVGENNQPLPDPNYGDQFNNFSIGGIGDEAVEKEGSIEITYQEIPGEYPDGTTYSLRKPTYEFTDLAYGELDPELMISPRVANQMIGLGLLEAINEADILALSDPEDQNNDGISGRANYVWDIESQTEVLGRFGWKANQPNIRQQVAGAFLGDIGITSSLFPNENCTIVQINCANTLNGGNPEIEDELLDDVVFYSQTLAVPARRNIENQTVLLGKILFNEIGCNSCHIEKITTGNDHEIAALRNQTIRPYTDLLLHDMGDDLADGRPDFLANGNEWRTPPLWGIGLFQKVNNHTFYLHDGRARNIEEAILWHGGEALSAKENFMNLSSSDREALINFLNSL